MEKYIQENGHKKQEEIRILLPGKNRLQTKTIQKRQGKRLHIISGKKIYQQYIAILKVYTPNTRTHEFIKGILLQLKSQLDTG